MWTCPDCDFYNDDEDRFCGDCGRLRPLKRPTEKTVDVDKPAFCTWCGADLSEAHTFCPNCGRRLDGREDDPERLARPADIPPREPVKKQKNKNTGLWILFLITLAVVAFVTVLVVENIRESGGRADYSSFSMTAPRDTITFGSFGQDNNRLNGAEPVEWLVPDIVTATL